MFEFVRHSRLKRSLPPMPGDPRTRDGALPSMLDTVLRPEVDYYGWERLQEMSFDIQVSTPNVTGFTVVLPGVEQDPRSDQIVVIHSMRAFTDAGAANTRLWISWRNRLAAPTVLILREPTVVVPGEPIGIPRPFAAPLHSLRVDADVALGVAQSFHTDVAYCVLPAHEYIPGLL